MLNQPVHAEDGIETRRVESVELSWKLDLVDTESQITTGGVGCHLRGGGLYHQKMAQRGNGKAVFGNKILRDEKIGRAHV